MNQPHQTTALLEVREVHRDFGGVHAVNGVSFAVKARGITGLIGPNGAGKSTLLKALMGLLRVMRGAVLLGGEDVTNLRTDELARKGVGYGTAVLLVEQRAASALGISDWAYVLVAGSVRLSGAAAELLARPDFAEVYLGRSSGYGAESAFQAT